MRKVVVLTSSYPRNDGDFAGRFVADAVAQLRTRGLEVEVVHPELSADGGGLVRTLRRRPWLALTLFVSLVRRLRRAARDADLVHAHWLARAPLPPFPRHPLPPTPHPPRSPRPPPALPLAAPPPRPLPLPPRP